MPPNKNRLRILEHLNVITSYPSKLAQVPSRKGPNLSAHQEFPPSYLTKPSWCGCTHFTEVSALPCFSLEGRLRCFHQIPPLEKVSEVCLHRGREFLPQTGSSTSQEDPSESLKVGFWAWKPHLYSLPTCLRASFRQGLRGKTGFPW